nr:unnamed protein product [Naegleria fowleri]
MNDENINGDTMVGEDDDYNVDSLDQLPKIKHVALLPTSDVVKGRFSHTVTHYNNKIYVFGGAVERGVYDNELYCFDIDLNRWYTIEAKGKKPLKRIFHTMVLDQKNERLLLFGGRKEGGTKLNDFFGFDLRTETWNKIEVPDMPKATDGHSAVFCKDTNSMVIFGGHDGTNYIDSLFEFNFDTNTWSKITCENEMPSGRAYHTAQYSSKHKCMIITGGKIQGNVSTSQTFVYSFKTKRWSKLDMESSDSASSENAKTLPKVLCSCSTMINEDKMIMFGGEDSQQKCCDEFWLFDFLSLKWMYLPIPENFTVPKLSRLGMVYNTRNASIYMFGGYSAEGKRTNDFYQIQFDAPPQLTYIPIVNDITQNIPFFELGRSYQLENRYFDMIVTTPKKSFAAHKVILSQCSALNVFSLTPDSETKIVSVSINFQVEFSKVLSFLYGIEPDTTDNETLELMSFASTYQVKSLLIWCMFRIQTSSLEKQTIEEICSKFDANYQNLISDPTLDLHPSESLQIHLGNRLQELKDGISHGDFKITIPNCSQPFYCDKALLIARSDFFRSMLTHGFKEKHNNEVVMDQVDSPKQMNLLIEHIYGIQITENKDLSIRELMLLLIMANFYCMRQLYQEVLRVLISNVNEENALEILINTNHLSNASNIERKLQNICLTSIRKKDLSDRLIEMASDINMLQQENAALESKVEELKNEVEQLKKKLNSQ